MKAITDLLFQAHQLKRTRRTGYEFLGSGAESVAEHSFSATFVGFILSRLEPGTDTLRLISMCLIHDLAEARTGDLNYLQKKYVQCHEEKAMADTVKDLPFGSELAQMAAEFNAGRTLEAQLANDADQLAFILDLKALADMGYSPPTNWMESVCKRLKTPIGQNLAQEILKTPWDRWWRQLFD